MKIIIIIDETTFFHPDYLDKILKLGKGNIFKIGIVTKIPKKNNISTFFLYNFLEFSLKDLLLINLRNIIFLICSKIFPKGINAKNFSVLGVCKKNKIDFFSIEKDINTKKNIDIIKHFDPNIVMSSNSLIFKKELLSLSNIFFINRHTSLLPSYGGLLPVIHAIINHENEIGVSIHKINNKIDSGDVIGQEKISIKDNRSLYSIYKIAFDKSAYLTLKVFNDFQEKNVEIIDNKLNSSYFTFPTKKELKYFKKIGGRII